MFVYHWRVIQALDILQILVLLNIYKPYSIGQFFWNKLSIQYPIFCVYCYFILGSESKISNQAFLIRLSGVQFIPLYEISLQFGCDISGITTDILGINTPWLFKDDLATDVWCSLIKDLTYLTTPAWASLCMFTPEKHHIIFLGKLVTRPELRLL